MSTLIGRIFHAFTAFFSIPRTAFEECRGEFEEGILDASLLERDSSGAYTDPRVEDAFLTLSKEKLNEVMAQW